MPFLLIFQMLINKIVSVNEVSTLLLFMLFVKIRLDKSSTVVVEVATIVGNSVHVFLSNLLSVQIFTTK